MQLQDGEWQAVRGLFALSTIVKVPCIPWFFWWRYDTWMTATLQLRCINVSDVAAGENVKLYEASSARRHLHAIVPVPPIL